ncbi:MAG: hypothetical protein AB1657_05060 [Candidatus Micrarchaeota archaeon]
MLVTKAAKLFLGLFAVSLVYFAVTPGQGLLELLKYTSLSLGISILFILLYPRVKQVRKGDQVLIASMGPLPSLFGFTATAVTGAAIGEEVRVKIGKGREAVGMVESYEGLFSPPRIRLIYEARE